MIRESTPFELAGVLHLACEETPVYKGKTSLESTLLGLAKFDCYAIEKDGEVIGGVIFRGDEGHIAVLSRFRKHWAGREFYRFMRGQVEGRGVIQVSCGNPDALPFIKRLEERGYVCLNES